ncbi:Putative trypsin-like serine protease [Corynebacterium glyciniphilum AJ 3170]|uniref:Putative trypsin-like serine protease n=1 Tax=Corynebacterium glyciniphilum AJ 3170 TaxID=1404245 RepID=X5DSK3_9CORY|nr:MarP family serine protease [Corynebacterium glyciniphilum]AHW63657.1 Putative trypsin-like serine protease [Corynebacterium glyciniphilum AJ 3170]
MMVDLIVIAILILSLTAGLRAGFFSSLGSLVGLIGGALLVPWAVPAVTSAVSDPSWRWLAGAVTISVLLLVGSAVGSSLGSLARHGADRLKLRVPERILGGVVSTMVAAVALSLVGTGVASAGVPGLSPAVSSSATLRAVDDVLPDRLRQAGDEIRAALFDETFLPSIPGTSLPTPSPGRGPTPPESPLPDADTKSPSLVTASESVARISGIASACRMMPTGSGFVVADDRVITNAHVVAGVDAPVVTLQDGQAADGRVVYFNEDDDIAVIAADVDAHPLAVADDVAPGDVGVVQGYPGGGPFQSVNARVVAAGPTQFGGGGAGVPPSFRSVVRLQTEVVPGNSGGPFLTPAGEVAGVVFARDETTPSTGYAVTVDALERAAASFVADAPSVPSGQCAAQ